MNTLNLESRSAISHRVFSGVQPSGAQVHVGNYLGAMRRFVSLSETYDTMICLVDLHALTSVEKASDLREFTTSLAASYLAIGLKPERTIIFRQSDVPEVCELAWYLACQFPLGLLERAHKLKDSRAKNLNINSGLMFYPILMAADILLYQGTLVPVGADQKQHLEMSREIAQRINHIYGEGLLAVPEPLIEENTGVVPGLDGRKMSKSYNNYIGLFESPKELKEKVSRIVTDSKGLEEIKDPDHCNIFRLYRLLASQDEIQELAQRYRAGGLGYGHAKAELLKVLGRTLEPMRLSYESWKSRPTELNDILAAGAKKARTIAEKTMSDLRDAIGLGGKL